MKRPMLNFGPGDDKKEREYKPMRNDKLFWQGTVVAVQPRLRLTRSFDQRYHTYLGYVLRLQGQIDDEDEAGDFLVLSGNKLPDAILA